VHDFPRDDYIKELEKNEHSAEFKQETLAYIDNLMYAGFPVVFSLKHFAQIMDMKYSELKSMTEFRERLYHTFEIPKRKGGTRPIDSPDDKLKTLQRWIMRNILEKVPLADNCTGFRKDMSIKNNALFHSEQEWILKIDLLKFFETIGEKRVYHMFKKLGYHNNLCVDFAKLLTIDKDRKGGVLPQGAPSSPLISNIVASKLDERFIKFAEKLSLNYSRYADDITFSGLNVPIPSIKIIEKIVQECGFKLNHEKISIRRRGQQQIVTGISVANGLHIPRKYKRDTWTHIYFCKRNGVEEHLKRRGITNSSFQDWLLGRIYFIHSIEQNTGKKMLFEFNQIDWSV
jgi:retron-type reverse transcriptase